MEKISWTDRVRNEPGRKEIFCIQQKEGRLAGLATSCAGTEFWNTLLKEKQREG